MEQTVPVALELRRALYAVPVGVLCGMLFDIMRILRALLPHHFIAVFLEDTLFSFLCCFMMQCYAWSFCGGALRWQYAAAAGIGLCLWLLTVGAVTARILRRWMRFGCAMQRKIRRVFVGNTENPDAEEKIPEST